MAIDRQLSGISFDYTQSQSGIAANSIAILNSLKDNLGNSVNQTNSQVVTDVVVAGKELISPYITVDSLRVNTISAAASQGGLVIEQSTAIKGGLKIDRLSSLADALAIDSDVEFFGRPYFTSDTVGFAKILPGQRFVDVVFDKQYLNQPTVSAMLTLEDDPQLQNETDPAVIAQIRTAQDAQTDLLFNEGYQFIVSRKSEKGFRIILNKPASQNLYFSWIALATKQPKIFISQATEQPPVQSGSTAGSSDGSTGSLPPLDLGSPDGSDNNSDSSAPDTTTDSSGTTGDSSITGS